MTRRKKQRKQQKPRADTRPLVHAKVAYVERDLAGASALVKPAVLYADHVTIYSPVASLVRSVYELRSIKKDHRRALVALDLIRSVPSLAGQLDADAATLEQLRSVLSVDPRRTQRVAGRFGRGDVVHALGALREQLTALSHVWEKELLGPVPRKHSEALLRVFVNAAFRVPPPRSSPRPVLGCG